MTLRVDRTVCPPFWEKVNLAYQLDTLDGCLCCGMPYDIASGRVDTLEVDGDRAEQILSWCRGPVWDVVLFSEEPTALAPFFALDEQTWKRENQWPSEGPVPVWVE